MESNLIDKHMNSLYETKAGLRTTRQRVNPRERPIIITCTSPRIDPVGIFDLADGEAFVFRAAGNVVTGETYRSVLLAMMTDRISDVIVLGHADCTSADSGKVYKNLDKFVTKFPQRSYFRDVLSTREKAAKYFVLFSDAIDNVRVQVENLQFLKAIQPSLNVTGMLYNPRNGQVYTMAELDQLRRVLAQSPEKHIDELVPTRYKNYESKRNQARPAVPSRQARPHVEISQETSHGVDGEGMDEEVDDEGAEETRVVDLPSEFSDQQLAFEKMMEAMQKSITKLARVRIFTPKIRMPRIKGISLASERGTPPA